MVLQASSRGAAQQSTTCPGRGIGISLFPSHISGLCLQIWTPAWHLMLWSPCPKCEGRRRTCGCKNLGCFIGIAAGVQPMDLNPWSPSWGLDLSLYFPLHSQFEQTEKKPSCLTWVPGLCQHPILLGKVFPGTAPRAEPRGGSDGDGNIPARG